jgi:glycine oxidase
MKGLARRRVAVAGAGVVGSSIALVLAKAGAEVLLVDPAALGDNASGVAAGMLAPAFEAALDEPAGRHFELLCAARDRWTAFAEPLGPDRIGLRRSGGLWAAAPDDPEGTLEIRLRTLQALGAAVEVLSSAAVRRLAPGLRDEIGPGLFTSEDWRLQPLPGLARLREAAIGAGAVVAAQRLVAFEGGTCRFADGATFAAGQLVVATGAEVTMLAPELRLLAPIKGHILRFPSVIGRDHPPPLRYGGGYAVGGPAGLTVGATMEPGRSDRRIDEAAVAGLRRLAISLYPGLEGAEATAKAGVRAATPDRLPLVGPSSRPDVFLAVGVRRNGWLLAPLIADMIAAHLAGCDAGVFGEALDARRFAGDHYG